MTNTTENKQILNKAVQKYSDLTSIRILMNLIPYVGSSLDIFLESRANKIQEERLEELLNNIRNNLTELDEKKIDKNFCKSEEFLELFVLTTTKVVNSHRKEKRLLLAKALTQSLISSNSKKYYKERIIKIIADLSPVHIKILEYIYSKQKNELKERSIEEIKTPVSNNDLASEKEFAKFKRYELDAFANDLVRYALLEDWGIGRFDYSVGRYRITEGTIDFLLYLALIITKDMDTNRSNNSF